MIPDPTKDHRYTPPADILAGSDAKSLICVPLKSKDRVLGVIQIRRKGEDVAPFGEEDLTTLAVIADYAAIAIENARNFKRIEELTITDDLTTLYNVRYLHQLLDAEILRADRYKKHFSMIFLDLDHFKNVNDTHGHIHGSTLLRETAEIIQRGIRAVDYAARYGGDEFVVLLPETDKKDAMTIAERLRDSIEKNVFLKDQDLKIQFTASFGVATFPNDAQSKDDLIRMADEAMYKVKNTTRNRVATIE
jgi:diguanylate cyclase (GGDEF)-like protein